LVLLLILLATQPPALIIASPDGICRQHLVQELLEEHAGTMAGLEGTRRWVLAGHSMGARVACQVSGDVPQLVAACIGLSYPLHPPDQPTQLRDELLVGVQQPLLLVRGTRDPFSQQRLWDGVLQRLSSSMPIIHSVDAGDHSLKVAAGKESGAATAAALEAVCSAVQQFLQRLPQQDAAAAISQALESAAATEKDPGGATRTTKRAAAGAAVARKDSSKSAGGARKRKQVKSAPAAAAPNHKEKGAVKRRR
jgi:predicted alpha/beta-hydrolase family hydrolase